MLVRCIRSFAGRDGQGNLVAHGQGDVFELPKGVDWLLVGLVEIVELDASQERPMERKVMKAPEKRRKDGA